MTKTTDPIARYEHFRRSDPGNLALLMALGDLYHQAGRFDDALTTYREGLALDPSHAALRGREASVLISQQCFAEAEVLLQPLVQAAPGNAALWHNLGLVRYHQHRFDEARDAFTQARQRSETDAGRADPQTWAHLAYSHHHLGRLDDAREAAQRWAELEPSPRAEGYRALLDFDRLDHEAAYRRARATLDVAPDEVNAQVVCGVQALERQEVDRADSLFRSASRLEPDNARAWVGVALVRVYREEFERAIEAFERALVLQPRDSGTLVALGWTHFARMAYPDAEAAFRRAIEADRNFGEAHGGLASALVMQNRQDEAQRTIALARRLGSQGFGVVYAQAVMLGLQGQGETGGRLIDRALARPTRAGMPSLLDQTRLFLSRRAPPPGLPPMPAPGGPPGTADPSSN